MEENKDNLSQQNHTLAQNPQAENKSFFRRDKKFELFYILSGLFFGILVLIILFPAYKLLSKKENPINPTPFPQVKFLSREITNGKYSNEKYGVTFAIPLELKSGGNYYSDQSYESISMYPKAGDGVIENSISFELFSDRLNSSREGYQRLSDYRKLLSLAVGDRTSEPSFGNKCTDFIRESDKEINGVLWNIFYTEQNGTKCNPATWYSYTEIYLLHKDSVLYSFSVTPYKNTASDILHNDLSKILSTFKFTASADGKNQTVDTSSWKTYTNPGGWIHIHYPPGWSVENSHTRGNRAVENPNEINMATFSGSEGTLNIKWGPIGFGGGGCTNYTMLKLKNQTLKVCDVTNDKGEYWSDIYGDSESYEHIFGIKATSYNPINKNSPIIETILSTLSFEK